MDSGKTYERFVKNVLSLYISGGHLGLSADNTAIFLNKKYHSRQRRASIEADISIELYREENGAKKVVFVWLWECKFISEGGRRVHVGAIEEFSSKLEQVGRHNTKGTVITNSAFQKSAVSFAKSERIDLCRLDPPSRNIEFLHGHEATGARPPLVDCLVDASVRPWTEIVALSGAGDIHGSMAQYLSTTVRMLLDETHDHQ